MICPLLKIYSGGNALRSCQTIAIDKRISGLWVSHYPVCFSTSFMYYPPLLLNLKVQNMIFGLYIYMAIWCTSLCAKYLRRINSFCLSSQNALQLVQPCMSKSIHYQTCSYLYWNVRSCIVALLNGSLPWHFGYTSYTKTLKKCFPIHSQSLN